MPKIIDHKKNIGKKYGRLTILDVIKKDRYYYLCECECGRKKEIVASNVLYGQITTCGDVKCISESRLRHAKEMGMQTRKYEEVCISCGKKEHYAKGLCRNCYARMLRNGDAEYRHNYGGYNGGK